jgi:sugar diacid utilization regulator
MFTKNIVLETLQQYRGANYLDKNDDRAYKWISMLPSDPDEMERDILYTCMLSEAMERNLEKPGHNYLCIQDRPAGDSESAEALAGVIVINDEDMAISKLHNIVLRRFLQISEWVSNMQVALIENCDYQRLLDYCEPILNNFIAICDASYSLLAYTKNIPCRDPINVKLLEKGYHSEETMQKFKDKKRFEVYEQETGVLLSAPGVISRFEIIGKWCRYDGALLIHVVMECSQTHASLASVDLFEILMKHVNTCFVRQQRAQLSQTHTSLLNGILYDDIENPFILGERAKTAGIPVSGNFDAYVIAFEDNSIVLIGRFVQELMAYLPKSKVIAHNYKVSVLNIYSSQNVKTQSTKSLARVALLLEKYSATCGVSEPFTALPEFKDAHTQAECAQAMGPQLSAPRNFKMLSDNVYPIIAPRNNGCVYHYDDVYIYHMLQSAQSGPFAVFNHTAHMRALQKLIKYDEENETSLVQILYAHLISERRATASGKLLNMHRNNVRYHITRIEEILDMDLDDYWTRMKLMLTFHLLDIRYRQSFPDNSK